MLFRFKQFLSPPIFPDDPDKTAVAKILNAIILFLFVALVIIGIVVPLLSRSIPPHILLVIVGFVGLVGIGYLNNKGKTTAASWTMFILFWIAGVLSFIPTGGVQAPGHSLLLFLVVLVGVLLGWRIALAVTILNAIVGLLFLLADSQGEMPFSSLPDDDFRVWFFYTITAVLIALLLRVGLGSVRETLARAQYELHQRQLSEEKFTKIFMANPSALIISELENGIFLDTNESFTSLSGYHRDSVIGKTATELNIYSENNDRDKWVDSLKEQGFVRDLEMLLRHADGSSRTCRLSIEQIILNEIPCVITHVEDVTERKRTEEVAMQARDELRVREAQLRTILDNLPFWVWLKDVNGRFLLINDQFRRRRQGVSDIGKTDFDFTTPELAKKYLADEKRVMETRLPISIEEPVLIQPGEYKLHETYKAPFIDDDDNLLGTFGFSRDITEKKQAEIILQESESRFRGMFEDAGIGMVLVSLSHGIVQSNRAFANMLGYTVDELIGVHFKDVTYPDDVEVSVEYHKKLIEGEISDYQLEKRYLHKDGHIVWALLNVSLVYYADGKLNHAIAQVQHITDRKQAEADREMLIQELGRRNAELERFAYTVSHDLKSPLVTIGGFLGFLERDAESGDMEQLRTDIGSIQNAADKMRLLLDELLELSRIGRLINPPEEIPFREIVDDALALTQGQLLAHKVELLSADKFPVVVGDRMRLVEVVQNLVDNAAKFSKEQAQPTIRIGVRQSEGETVFFVQDNGIGIPAQYHEKIFDIFNKLDPDVEGTGIGLALVKRIVEVHNGRLWVESDGVGQGSTFCFTLPGGAVDAYDHS